MHHTDKTGHETDQQQTLRTSDRANPGFESTQQQHATATGTLPLSKHMCIKAHLCSNYCDSYSAQLSPCSGTQILGPVPEAPSTPTLCGNGLDPAKPHPAGPPGP
eukprot:GHUV01029095.1.p3 GENE.GHUV01029095.1~~GHUV01029095.1.p3  ORF type:complete len:105 (-),score=14.83 GHUV01029095.1:421-735(-)